MKLTIAILCCTPSLLAQPLTPAQKAAGWTILFDGADTSHWRGYRADAFPATWVIEDGALKCGGGGDIITKAQYADFELELEWKATPAANSGIMYRVTEAHDASWQTGPEYQILDDAGYGAAPTDMHSAGALYDLAAPAEGKALTPAGEFNHTRIIVNDGLVQHWLNGTKVVECRTDDASWKARIDASKFKVYNGFGVQPRGHIALQDHGNTLWFRNIRIRDLDAPMPGEIKLFNGRDLAGWKAFTPDAAGPAATWSILDGTLVCSGKPAGYLRTERTYQDFILRLEWRYMPDRAGNSGVLLRTTGEDKVWPRSVEAQLMSGQAGDFWNIGNIPMTTDPARTNGRNTRRAATNERPIGEWNQYEIIVDGGDITLLVNGMELNRATDVEHIPGWIALQAEGAEIHFRNIRLAPIER